MNAARMQNPVYVLPEALQALQGVNKVIDEGGLPAKTRELVNLRASQINGCSVCVDLGWRQLRKANETDERLFAVSAWRDAPYFTDQERAALALAEAATRIADQSDPVPDAIWDETARHFNERELAGLTLIIALTNTWNRLNLTTRQIAGEWLKSSAAKQWTEKHVAAD